MSGEQRRVALVTGASGGIGRAVAELAAARGWDVVVGYHRDAERARRVVAACEQHGGHALALAADVGAEAQVEAMFAATDERFGRLDAVVTSAGVVSPLGPVADMDAARIERVLQANVVGTLLCAREAVRRMAVSRGGRGGVIVTVSSRAAVRGGSGEYVDYAASKAAVDAITIGLAGEVVADGIRVVGVRPGVIDTAIHAPGRLQRVGPQLPLGRPGTVGEVAGAVLWLMSDEASYVTGTMLDVAGGR